VSVPRPEQALARLLAALEADLVAATDDEIMAAAKELGMNPAMQGSAAFGDIRVMLSPRQFRVDRWGKPIKEAAEDAKHNGTPSARSFVKRDAPHSR
jgi:hypothetical protein